MQHLCHTGEQLQEELVGDVVMAATSPPKPTRCPAEQSTVCLECVLTMLKMAAKLHNKSSMVPHVHRCVISGQFSQCGKWMMYLTILTHLGRKNSAFNKLYDSPVEIYEF